MKKEALLVTLLFCVQNLFALSSEVVLRGLSVYAGSDETNLPIVGVGNGLLTIQFDVLADEPPALKIRFFHCNRDWKVDDNLFVNDNTHNTSFYLGYKTSPGGVKGYSYRYINSFPDPDDAVRFSYSGNWIFTIMDKRETTLYAEGRFFVVDNSVPTNVTVTNDYLTANSSPYNQIQKLVARVKLADEMDGYYYTTVDVYQNRKLYQSYRIDIWDRNPYTHVDGQGTGERIFKITNIMPGNEYRVLDLSNVTRYPNKALVKNVEGADQMRLFWRTGADHNGDAFRNRFTGLNSDYLEVLFRLDMTSSDYRLVTSGGKDIFLVGEFNFWNPTQEDRLTKDDDERSYVVKKLLRRGIYDYQYVTGVWDAKNQEVIDQDWLAIEGNDWRTTTEYMVLVYYNDPRFGGFDRIVGYGVGRSSGNASVGTY
ncbi:MAG: type IX secretion system plug protein domain-containing protein [Bacteroidota bacterium]